MKNLLLITAVLAAGLGARQSAQAQVQIEIEPDQKTISLGEPVNVHLTAKNNTGAPVVIDLGLNRQGALSFDISPPDGIVAHVAAPGLVGGTEILVRLSDVSLPPGETYRQLVRLGQWYSFTRPGTYFVTGHLGPQRPDMSISIDSAFSLEIIPADANRLRARCEQLLTKASESTVGSLDAAIDLSRIRDPIAVPYLGRMLAADPSERFAAIDGLEGIGTLEAADIVLSFLARAQGEDHRRAVAALVRIGESTNNQPVSDRIAAAGLLRK